MWRRGRVCYQTKQWPGPELGQHQRVSKRDHCRPPPNKREPKQRPAVSYDRLPAHTATQTPADVTPRPLAPSEGRPSTSKYRDGCGQAHRRRAGASKPTTASARGCRGARPLVNPTHPRHRHRSRSGEQHRNSEIRRRRQDNRRRPGIQRENGRVRWAKKDSTHRLHQFRKRRGDGVHHMAPARGLHRQPPASSHQMVMAQGKPRSISEHFHAEPQRGRLRLDLAVVLVVTPRREGGQKQPHPARRPAHHRATGVDWPSESRAASPRGPGTPSPSPDAIRRGRTATTQDQTQRAPLRRLVVQGHSGW